MRTRRPRLGHWLLTTFNLLVFAFLLAPVVVVVASAFGRSYYLTFPPYGFTLQAFKNALADTDYRDAFSMSIEVGIGAALLATVIGGLAAISLARGRLPGKNLMTSLFMSPLVVPTLVLAVAMLTLASDLGIGPTGYRLIVSHVIITVPYVLRVVLPAMERMDPALVEAAKDLGASPWRAFWRVTFPLVRSSWIVGAVFAFMISFDELVMSLFLAPPASPTLPVKLYSALEFGLDPKVAAISAMLIVVTGVVTVVGQLIADLRKVA